MEWSSKDEEQENGHFPTSESSGDGDKGNNGLEVRIQHALRKKSSSESDETESPDQQRNSTHARASNSPRGEIEADDYGHDQKADGSIRGDNTLLTEEKRVNGHDHRKKSFEDNSSGLEYEWPGNDNVESLSSEQLCSFSQKEDRAIYRDRDDSLSHVSYCNKLPLPPDDLTAFQHTDETSYYDDDRITNLRVDSVNSQITAPRKMEKRSTRTPECGRSDSAFPRRSTESTESKSPLQRRGFRSSLTPTENAALADGSQQVGGNEGGKRLSLRQRLRSISRESKSELEGLWPTSRRPSLINSRRQSRSSIFTRSSFLSKEWMADEHEDDNEDEVEALSYFGSSQQFIPMNRKGGYTSTMYTRAMVPDERLDAANYRLRRVQKSFAEVLWNHLNDAALRFEQRVALSLVKPSLDTPPNQTYFQFEEVEEHSVPCTSVRYEELPLFVSGLACTLGNRRFVNKGETCAIFAPCSPLYYVVILAVLRCQGRLALFSFDDLGKDLLRIGVPGGKLSLSRYVFDIAKLLCDVKPSTIFVNSASLLAVMCAVQLIAFSAFEDVGRSKLVHPNYVEQLEWVKNINFVSLDQPLFSFIGEGVHFIGDSWIADQRLKSRYWKYRDCCEGSQFLYNSGSSFRLTWPEDQQQFQRSVERTASALSGSYVYYAMPFIEQGFTKREVLPDLQDSSDRSIIAFMSGFDEISGTAIWSPVANLPTKRDYMWSMQHADKGSNPFISEREDHFDSIVLTLSGKMIRVPVHPVKERYGYHTLLDELFVPLSNGLTIYVEDCGFHRLPPMDPHRRDSSIVRSPSKSRRSPATPNLRLSTSPKKCSPCPSTGPILSVKDLARNDGLLY